MKIEKKESLLFILQVVLFYVTPLMNQNGNPIGMVILLLLMTFLLSLLMGYFSKSWLSFIYPFFTAGAFLPSVWIYYNESAMIHSLWYLIVASIGVLLGKVLPLMRKQKEKQNRKNEDDSKWNKQGNVFLFVGLWFFILYLFMRYIMYLLLPFD